MKSNLFVEWGTRKMVYVCTARPRPEGSHRRYVRCNIALTAWGFIYQRGKAKYSSTALAHSANTSLLLRGPSLVRVPLHWMTLCYVHTSLLKNSLHVVNQMVPISEGAPSSRKTFGTGSLGYTLGYGWVWLRMRMLLRERAEGPEPLY